MASFVFSDNESDDEFMRTVQPVFSQRSSQANDEEEDSPELTQSTVQSVESPPPAEAPIAVVLTPEEIEVKGMYYNNASIIARLFFCELLPCCVLVTLH